MTNPIRDIEHAHMWLSFDTLRISPKNLSPESIRKIEQMCAERGLSCIRGSQGVLRISGNATEVEVLHKAISKRMMPSPMIQAIQRATQQGAQVARQATQRTIQRTANVVRTISTSPEVTGAMVAAGRGVRAVGRTARGGAPLLMAMAAIDPEGTQEFIDDIFHLRVGKIATDMYEGGKQIVLHPVDTTTEIANTVADKTSDYYAGTKDGTDFAERTAMIAVHGINNIGKTMAHAGNYEWGLVGSFRDSERAGINWVMNACGFDTEIVREGTSIRDFQQDPFKFFYNISVLGLLNPTTRDKTTGLRSDDDFNSIIFRGDTNAFAAYLNTGVNVNTRIAGEHDGGSHPYQTAFALAIAEDQFDIAKMLFDRQETNINAINELTGDTPLINAIRYTALNEYESEYYTGKPDMSNATEAARAKYLQANALILGMIYDNRIDLNATNRYGQSAFLFAAECGNLGAVQALVAKNADIHHTNIWGQNALHVACCNRLMTEELLNLGIDANAKDRDGNTPLMTALEKNEENGGRNDIAVCLLLDQMNEDGLRALLASEKHAELLNEWIECYPQVKEAIMEMENHPLQQHEMHNQHRLTETLSNAQGTPTTSGVETENNTETVNAQHVNSTTR